MESAVSGESDSCGMVASCIAGILVAVAIDASSKADVNSSVNTLLNSSTTSRLPIPGPPSSEYSDRFVGLSSRAA